MWASDSGYVTEYCDMYMDMSNYNVIHVNQTADPQYGVVYGKMCLLDDDLQGSLYILIVMNIYHFNVK